MINLKNLPVDSGPPLVLLTQQLAEVNIIPAVTRLLVHHVEVWTGQGFVDRGNVGDEGVSRNQGRSTEGGRKAW